MTQSMNICEKLRHVKKIQARLFIALVIPPLVTGMLSGLLLQGPHCDSENRGNGPTKYLSGKTHEILSKCKETQRIWLAQVVTSLILKIQDN